LLNEAGGIIDDVIVYRRAGGHRLVSNAATRDRVIAWYAAQADGFDTLPAERDDIAMIAVQGPGAIARFAKATGLAQVAELKRFHALEAPDGRHHGWMIARTGYTGEDGVEVMLPALDAPGLWRELESAGVRPAGLGARDTLRLEAGLNLYGQDMDEKTTPLESNLAWTVAFEPQDRDFIGRAALEAQRLTGIGNKLTGIALDDRGVMRHGMRVITNAGEGEVRSGIFSPTLGYSIGLARVPRAAAGEIGILIRGRQGRGRIVRPPFIEKRK
jgi:aminomethyltransferase